MEKIVEDFLKEKGYENRIDENQESRVKSWLDLFEGKDKRYNVNIYNGIKYVKYKIKSLQLPTQVCGDLADFFFNEKLDDYDSYGKKNDKYIIINDLLKIYDII